MGGDVDRHALTVDAARDQRRLQRVDPVISSAAGSGTLSMPPGAMRSNRRPRSSTSAMQSSNPITPDRQAAVFSPIE